MTDAEFVKAVDAAVRLCSGLAEERDGDARWVDAMGGVAEPEMALLFLAEYLGAPDPGLALVAPDRIQAVLDGTLDI